MNSPMTSYPCSLRKCAATELSTPPLMARTTREGMQESPFSRDVAAERVRLRKTLRYRVAAKHHSTNAKRGPPPFTTAAVPACSSLGSFYYLGAPPWAP